MQIFITRGEDSSGPYTLEQVQDYLSQGVLLADDFAYHEGLEGWIPLEQLIAKSVPLEEPPHPSQMAEGTPPSKPEPVLAEVVRPPVKGKGKKKIVITIAACLVVAGVLGAVGIFFFKKDPAQEAQNKEPSKPVPVTEPTTPIKISGAEPGLPPSPTPNPSKPELGQPAPSKPQTGSLEQFITGKRIHFQMADGSGSFWSEFSADGTHRHSERPEGKFKVNGLKVIVHDPEPVGLVFQKPEITPGDTFEAKSPEAEKGLLFKVLKVETIPDIKTPSKPKTGSLEGNIKGKRFVCQAPGNKEALLQFEKDGVFNVAKISAGKISPEDDEMTYKADGLKVRVTENGKENGGVSFPTDNPKIGDKILVGGEGRQAIWSILKIEPAASLGDTPPKLSKIGLGQMLFGLQQPLTDQEKLLVGRWKEFDMEEPDTPLSHLIFRSDRSYTYLSTYPATDDEGNEIAGKTERLLAHGIWNIGADRLNYLELVQNGEKLQEADVWINELKSLTKDGYRAEEIFEGDTTKFRGLPVEKFAVAEMLPYNDDAALHSFDIRKAYNSAKGKGAEQINIFFSKPPKPSNSKPGLPLPPLPAEPAKPEK